MTGAESKNGHEESIASFGCSDCKRVYDDHLDARGQAQSRGENRCRRDQHWMRKPIFFPSDSQLYGLHCQMVFGGRPVEA